jgi:hypothetical protein
MTLLTGPAWAQGPLFGPAASDRDEADDSPETSVLEHPAAEASEEGPPGRPPVAAPGQNQPKPAAGGPAMSGSQKNAQGKKAPTPTPEQSQSDCGKGEAKTAEQKKKEKTEKEKKAKKKKELAKARAGAYKPMFYDNDFRYLEDPAYGDYDPIDGIKRLHPLDCWTLDFGGQYRARYHHENNFRGLGLTGRDDDFLLHRTRLFANAEAYGLFRAYVEYLDAVSFYEDLSPRVIEEDRSDFLNIFGDVLVWENGCGKLWGRAGRQELLYGNQRTVSPLDWANTRRTFQGYKVFWKGKEWDVDAFWVNPITPDPKNFDKPNQDQEFMGVYSVYKGVKDQTLDLYWLRLINNRFEFGAQNAFDFDTLGARWYGSRHNWLWEVEGGCQWGRNTDGTAHWAGAWTIGAGHKFCRCWEPTLWAYFDWASGDDARGAGNGWHHQLPLSHKYFGFMDLFGRRNIMSPNVLFTAKPHEKLTVLLWYYHFFLENRNDTPYTVVMSSFNPANAPGSRDLGDEIDLLLTWNVTARMNVQLGYSHFFAGDYYQTTPGAPTSADADFFYSHVEINF